MVQNLQEDQQKQLSPHTKNKEIEGYTLAMIQYIYNVDKNLCIHKYIYLVL